MIFPIAVKAGIALFTILMEDLAYRLRGGGFIQTGHDWIVRLIWAAALILGYFNVGYPWLLWFMPSIVVTSYLGLLIPHAYCMQMGRGAAPQKKWPSWFLRTLTDAEWTAMPQWARTAYDAMGMASIGFMRAFLVFAPFAIFSYLANQGLHIAGIARAVTALTILQPTGYYFGWKFPITIGKSLVKDSTDWGEFFNGAAWGIALILL